MQLTIVRLIVMLAYVIFTALLARVYGEPLFENPQLQ
jgi:hypothetical protein